MDAMRVAVVGPGAIGATYAAAVEEAGHEVVLCGRRAAPAPVVVREDGSEHRLASDVRADPAVAGEPVAWVLLAVKAHQTAGAAAWLHALCDSGTTVAVLQNGVEHRALVGPLAGEATILPTVVWCPSEAVAPGRVQQRGEARLSVPDEPAGAALAALFAGGSATVDVVADFTTEAWRKLTTNAVAGLLPITRRRIEVLSADGMHEVGLALARECVAVARAEGARLGDDDAVEIVERLVDMPPDMGTSILFDRLAGRPMEWDARNGVVRRAGARHGIATPISDVLVPLLAALDEAPA
jgi:2-dehydropantoate 2-reductase